MGYQTALGRVKGLGSVHSGSKSWLAQRITAVILAVLFIWLAANFACLIGKDLVTAQTWVAKPFNTVLLITFIFAAYYHAILGVRVILEDYVNKACQRIILVNVICVVLSMFGIAAIFSIIKTAVIA